MTREELNKEIDLVQARNRAAIERADATIKKYGPLILKHMESTDRVFRELREAARRR
jgi:DNA-binding HxlR family transcriptional regulator